jgi:hypothetical protein
MTGIDKFYTFLDRYGLVVANVNNSHVWTIRSMSTNRVMFCIFVRDAIDFTDYTETACVEQIMRNAFSD